VAGGEEAVGREAMRWLLTLFLGVASAANTVTIVYDRTTTRADLTPGWGFSALVDYQGHRVLFDTGNNPPAFLGNLAKLSIAKNSLEHVVISHEHPERDSLVKRHLPVGLLYFLNSLVPDKGQAEAVGLHADNIKSPTQIAPGIYSTGMISGFPDEQAMIIDTPSGLVILMACGHPGIAKMIEAAEQQRGRGSVRLLVGGLHLYEQPEADIRNVIADLKRLHVEAVAPAYCTGDLAVRLLREAYGAHIQEAGAGRVIELAASSSTHRSNPKMCCTTATNSAVSTPSGLHRDKPAAWMALSAIAAR
jgi:7,8-dihydropterin-6-yl-methyl-4-(beta-D-ribofuranosyl)aminobenzene 5'-phosphate synthase